MHVRMCLCVAWSRAFPTEPESREKGLPGVCPGTQPASTHMGGGREEKRGEEGG